MAAENGEVPVGAVIEHGGEVIAAAGNEREEKKDPTAHAEMIAIREAAGQLGRLAALGCTIYVTIEPCPMCAGAIYQARIERLVYGAADDKAGAAGTLMDIVRDPRLNHQDRGDLRRAGRRVRRHAQGILFQPSLNAFKVR